MLPFLQKDRDGHAVQALARDDTSVAQAVIGAGNSLVALPAQPGEHVEVVSTDLCRIAFGDSSVDATSGVRGLFNGGAVYRVPDDATHIAVTQVGSSSGFVTVTRLY